MVASIFVFAQRDGLPYGISLVFLILLHEGGHWIWMKASGLNPKAPMFIPGLGAFVAMTKMPDNEALHAWVALAGPLIGGVGCAVISAVGFVTHNSWLTNSANTGFMLNLMQMIPARPLDGGFIVQAVSRWLLIPGTILLFILALATGAPLIYVIAIVSLLSWGKTSPKDAAGRANVGTNVEGSEAASAPAVARPATGAERLGVAFAYLSTIGALLVGFMSTISDTGF